MEWIFHNMTKRHSDPFASNILGITATENRINYSSSPKNLFYWNEGMYYSTNVDNANFTFEFKKHKYIFSNYSLKGVNNRCAPYKWVIEGSEDGVTYQNLSVINRSLCNTEWLKNIECLNETFSIDKPMLVKFIRFVNTGGECYGNSKFLGLSAIDFYGCAN